MDFIEFILNPTRDLWGWVVCHTILMVLSSWGMRDCRSSTCFDRTSWFQSLSDRNSLYKDHKQCIVNKTYKNTIHFWDLQLPGWLPQKKCWIQCFFFSAGIVISFEANDALWNLITYCAATGGSLLVIGSAAGVAFMGMERQVSFGWCLGNFWVSLLTCVFGGKSDSPLASSLRPDPRWTID